MLGSSEEMSHQNSVSWPQRRLPFSSQLFTCGFTCPRVCQEKIAALQDVSKGQQGVRPGPSGRGAPWTDWTPLVTTIKCKVSRSACASELRAPGHERARVAADFRHAQNLHAGKCPHTQVFLQQVRRRHSLIKLALLTSAAARQLICSVWLNKHSNTSQRSRGTAWTRHICQARTQPLSAADGQVYACL